MQLIAYVRVSTAEQDSLAAQESSIRRYCEALGHDLTDVYSDKASGSGMIGRDGLRSLLARLEGDDVDGVIVTKIDRLSRSMKDWSTLVEEYFQKGGLNKKLVALDMNIDTSTATGELFLNLMIMLSQWERRMIGERTSEALQEMRAEGRRVGGRPPYGWKAGGKGKAWWIPHPAERLRIYTMRAIREELGYGNKRIADWLNDHGLFHKLGKKWTEYKVWYVRQRCEKSMSVPQPPDFKLSDVVDQTKSPYLRTDLMNKCTMRLFDAGLLDDYLDTDLHYEPTIEDQLEVHETDGGGHTAAVIGEGEQMIALWYFPEEDLGSWRKLARLAGGGIVDYADYIRMLNHIDFEYREAGYRVVWVNIHVRQLVGEVKRRGLDNTSENRAAILSLVAAQATGVSELDDVSLTTHGKSGYLLKNLLSNADKTGSGEPAAEF